MRTVALTLILVAVYALSTPAEAQSVDDTTPAIGSLLQRGRSVTVTDRVIPGYERIGVDVGPFIVNPDVIVGVFAVDNLYATGTSRVSDVALTVAPSVTAGFDIDHTRATITANSRFRRFASRTSENNNIYGLDARVNRDVGSGFTLGLRGGYRRDAENRSDPGAINNSIRPILFDIGNIGGSVTWQSARVRMQGTGQYSDVSFQDGRLADGAVLPQSYRDRKVTSFSGVGDYALTADLALRIRASYADNEYDVSQSLNVLDRSSRRMELLGGATFEFTDLLRGEIGIGYIDQKYASPLLTDFGGVGGRIQIAYLASQLTTVTLLATRTIEPAGTPLSPFFLRSSVTLTIDHELYRNVIVSGYAGYQENKFFQPVRLDKRPSAGASVSYKLNRGLSIFARYDYLDVTADPSDLGRTLTLNAASLGVDFGL